MIVKFLFSLLVLSTIMSCTRAQTSEYYTQDQPAVSETDTLFYWERLQEKAAEAKTYVKGSGKFNEHLAILIDMRIPSGKNRFFIVDLDSMKVLHEGLVAHGSGSETGTSDSLVFSNTPNSYCTSLGKYRIGQAYEGNFGRSYKLHGLDPTNSKAFERYVVLHRYSCVPDDEQPEPICNSLGCPMVSENFFLTVDKVIRQSDKPLLLEIYY